MLPAEDAYGRVENMSSRLWNADARSELYIKLYVSIDRTADSHHSLFDAGIM